MEENNNQIIDENTPPQRIDLPSIDTASQVPISEASVPSITPETTNASVETSAEVASKEEIPVPVSPKEVVETNIKEGESIPESDIEVLVDNKELTNVEPEKKQKLKIKLNFGKKTMPFNLALICIALALIIGISIGASMFSKTMYSNASNINANANTSARVSDGKNNSTIAGDYTFKVPQKYYYDKFSNGVLIYDTNDSFRIYIKPIKIKYDDIANAKTSIKATLESREIKVYNIKEININEHAFLVAETIDYLTNRMVAFTASSNEEDSFFIEIVTNDNKYNYDCLDLADDIAKNAEAINGTSKMESIEVNDISSIIMSAANIYSTIK